MKKSTTKAVKEEAANQQQGRCTIAWNNESTIIIKDGNIWKYHQLQTNKIYLNPSSVGYWGVLLDTYAIYKYILLCMRVYVKSKLRPY